MRKSLEEASEKADAIFHAPGPLEDRCKKMIDMLKTVSNQWVVDGIVT